MIMGKKTLYNEIKENNFKKVCKILFLFQTFFLHKKNIALVFKQNIELRQ